MDFQAHLTSSATRRSGTLRRPGTQLGDWELVARLAEGEWATIYAARPGACPSDWPADYAVKVAKQKTEGGVSAASLLAREALVGQSVAHRHLIAVLSAHVDGSPSYLVMPLLSGATVERAVVSHGPFPTPHALWIARQVAEALEALHEAGWMHADVKPGNVVVSAEGHATLVDLGFALKLRSRECAAKSELRGTMTYTAPEMISSTEPIDGQCDIYSLGVTLYEMLTGRPPFADQDAGRLALAHLQQPVPDARRVRPLLDRDVCRLLSTMLAKHPLRRPNATELARQLAALEIATLDERVA